MRQGPATALLSTAILLAVLALLPLSLAAGDHMRFRGAGEWDAAALPRSRHEAQELDGDADNVSRSSILFLTDGELRVW